MVVRLQWLGVKADIRFGVCLAPFFCIHSALMLRKTILTELLQVYSCIRLLHVNFTKTGAAFLVMSTICL